MKRLDLTLETAAENLALDEALLETAESASQYPEILRLWEPTAPMVVLGRSSPIDREVNRAVCQRHGIEVLRRCSGGATIVTGPGCLMYSVLLDYRKRPALRMLERVHRFVMGQIKEAIERLGIEVAIQGTSDLTVNNQKISGNSLRCKRNWLIYHGTLLYDFDLRIITDCLGSPQRQPFYRNARSHADFLTLLPADPQLLRQSIISQWSADEPFDDWPQALTRQLATEKYQTVEWTEKL